jgi:catechol 2,3-dioxygenase-like lactoylglutathione lyase family enzyme
VGKAGHGDQPEPIRLIGLDHVQVAAPAGSEDAARRFYGELLGMPELPKPPTLQARGGVWFVCGAHQLHVGIAEPFAPAAKAHPAIAVAES